MEFVNVVENAAAEMGYTALRDKQKEAILGFLRGRDVFVSLPTGSGKSLCYSVLPKVFDTLKRKKAKSIAIVVSPLPRISLMKDQLHSLESKGIKATFVTRDLATDADSPVEAALYEGQYQIVFFSPEALLCEDTWREMLQSQVYRDNVIAFVIDEAHLVKKWGDSFRREFANLGEVSSLLPNVHIMALTATASKSTRKAICRSLAMKKVLLVSQSPNKSNLFYCLDSHQKDVKEAFAPLVIELKQERTNTNRTIIFCRSYNSCINVYYYFKSSMGKDLSQPKGYPNLAELRMVDMYTACTHPVVKDIILKQFQQPQSVLRVIVATIAFGMGLNYPNVRRIIHWGPPEDIETFIQETGRAGRDGLPATAKIFSAVKDSPSHIDDKMKEYCELKGECRRKYLLNEFDSTEDEAAADIIACKCCDLCATKCTCLLNEFDSTEDEAAADIIACKCCDLCATKCTCQLCNNNN